MTRDDYVAFLSDANVANPDPNAARSDRGAIGYVTDFVSNGTRDAGGMAELNLGILPAGGEINFTLYYGAAPTEAAAMAAISTVGAQVYNLGQPGSGPTSGAPITGILAFDGSRLPLNCLPDEPC